MSYTFPNGQPQGEATTTINKLREILIAELFAINGYAMHIANTNMEDVKHLLEHIMQEEKKHYDMIIKLLRKFDPSQNKEYLKVKAEVSEPKSPMQKYTPDYNNQLILNNIRYDLKGEFEAVILYDDVVAHSINKEIKDTINDIINQEKHHSELLTNLLAKYVKDE